MRDASGSRTSRITHHVLRICDPMASPEQQGKSGPRRGGPPRAGLLVLGIAAFLALVVFLATRSPGGPPTPPSGPVTIINAPATNAAPNPAPANAPAGNHPAANRPP